MPVSAVRRERVSAAEPVDRNARLLTTVTHDCAWWPNFVASQGRKQGSFSAERLREFLLGYQRYLYLLAKHEQRMEWIGAASDGLPCLVSLWPRLRTVSRH